MRYPSLLFGRWSVALVGAALAVAAGAQEVGQIKIAKGAVTIERAGQTLPGDIGTRLEPSDTVRTGADGSVGITMQDDSLLSAGPNSVITLDRYVFDPTTRQGEFETTLQKGSLAIISGRIAKQSPTAMKVRTPSSILGVRGTEFVVSVDD